MGTRVTGSTTSSTTTSPATSRRTASPSPDRFTSTASQGLPDSWPLVRVLLRKTDAAYLSDRRLPFLKATNYLESTLGHTFWALAWGRKSVTRGRDHCYVICQRQMWNSTAIESCNRISSAMIFVLCSTLCSVCRITQVSNMYCLQKLWYMSHTSLIIVDVTSCTMPAAMKTKFLRVGPELSPPSGNYLIK